MPKLCPFMSEDMSDLNGKNVSCVESCALHFNGYCSINVLAQTAYRQYMEKHKSTEKGQAAESQK